jgi:hypothetical protein
MRHQMRRGVHHTGLCDLPSRMFCDWYGGKHPHLSAHPSTPTPPHSLLPLTRTLLIHCRVSYRGLHTQQHATCGMQRNIITLLLSSPSVLIRWHMQP